MVGRQPGRALAIVKNILDRRSGQPETASPERDRVVLDLHQTDGRTRGTARREPNAAVGFFPKRVIDRIDDKSVLLVKRADPAAADMMDAVFADPQRSGIVLKKIGLELVAGQVERRIESGSVLCFGHTARSDAPDTAEFAVDDKRFGRLVFPLDKLECSADEPVPTLGGAVLVLDQKPQFAARFAPDLGNIMARHLL